MNIAYKIHFQQRLQDGSFLIGIAIMLILILSTYALAYDNVRKSRDKLSPKEISEIRNLADNMPLRQVIGQLLIVGPPGDAKNYLGRDDLKSFVKEFKIGNIFLSTYHYPIEGKETPKTTINLIRSFHRYLRELYQVNKLPPPILFVDFENSEINSFQHQSAILAPPSALTLAATLDEFLIRSCGRYVGYQLRFLGIDAIFGPVVDIDGTKQGTYNKLINNRVFGGTPEIVYNSASHYLFGLKEAGVFTFLKHYPGYGSTTGQEYEKEYPKFNGDIENLKKNLMPFRALGPYASGIVSSHIKMTQFTPTEIVTFSPIFMTQLLREEITELGDDIQGLTLSETILITDDLSNMGSIQKYLEDNEHLTYYNIALSALNAGHDLVLFNHLETEQRRRGHFGSFGINELKDVIDGLVKTAKTNKSFENRLRKSLFRILKLKALMLLSWDDLRDDLIYSDENVDLLFWKLPPDVEGSIDYPSYLRNEKFTSGQEIALEIMRKSYSEILPNSEILSFKNMCNSSIMFLSDKLIHIFTEAFPEGNIKFKKIPTNWGHGTRRQKHWNEMKDELKKAVISERDCIIYIFTDPIDDKNLIKHLADLTDNNLNKRRKIIILLHTSPKDLPPSALSRFRILGNFSIHILAIEADIDLINGLIVPHRYKDLPTHVGKLGEIVSPICRLNSANNLEPLDLFTTESERLFNERIINIQKNCKKNIQNLQNKIENYKFLKKKAKKIFLFGFRIVGFIFLVTGVVIIIMIIRSFLPIPSTEGRKAYEILLHILLEIFQKSLSKAFTFILAFVLIIIGGAFLFDIGIEGLYSFAKTKLKNWLSNQPHTKM